ncbi:MAG: J domain-containing protein [Synechococcus sp. TMED155]|nr:MAG: J domain-containing protein [Synechococcus sp. TMED155]
MVQDPYRVLGVAPGATAAEIKSAYRSLVKQHHPDAVDAAGCDPERILAINAAWEVLGDPEARQHFDAGRSERAAHSTATAASAAAPRRRSAAADADLERWLEQVYGPLDRLLGQVLDPFTAQLKALSADPYDDGLMEGFCSYLERSRQKLDKAETLYRSCACPSAARGFGLSVYHFLSGVQDAITELERYTAGYVDDYLRDGRDMIREANLRRRRLQAQLPG